MNPATFCLTGSVSYREVAGESMHPAFGKQSVKKQCLHNMYQEGAAWYD